MQARQLLLGGFEEAGRWERLGYWEALEVVRNRSLTSKVIISSSGGKDSVAAMLLALFESGIERRQLIVHHQLIPEDWPGTLDYLKKLCRELVVPRFFDRAAYTGFECSNCRHRYLSSDHQKSLCPRCRESAGKPVAIVRGVVDLMWWRGRFPDASVRFCTSYLKTAVFNRFVLRNLQYLGPNPVVVLGERRRESSHRSQLPYMRERQLGPRARGFSMLEWRPLLDFKRIEVFRKLREYGIKPHYAYKAQGLTEDQMYHRDEEGGPRVSCRHCFFSSPSQIQAAASLPENKSFFGELIRFEEEAGHFWRRGLSITQVLEGKPKPLPVVEGQSCFDSEVPEEMAS